MSTWMLILTVALRSGSGVAVTVSSVPFTSEQACRSAASAWLLEQKRVAEQASSYGAGISAICTKA